MRIEKLSLVNFRNCEKIALKFTDSLNIIIGDNAQGKTNILESIIFLGLTKSYRVNFNQDLIMFSKSKSQINGVIRIDKIITKLNIVITKEEKNLYVNDTPVKKVAEYIKNFKLISFTPDDLDIIKGSPSIRRNLLNMELSQLSNEYITIYNEFNKILKTRNEYLKLLLNNSLADKKYLDVITKKLIEKEIFIYKKRIEYINLINTSISSFYNDIFGEGSLEIVYLPSISFINDKEINLEQKIEELYNNNYFKELNYGMTLYGPHRDDFIFKLNNQDLRLYGSQGQQKLSILAYKLSEISIFEYFCNTKPVLMLDDIFSELDIKKRNKLLKFIKENEIQTIITTTDLKNINKKYLENAYIYEVKNGNIIRK